MMAVMRVDRKAVEKVAWKGEKRVERRVVCWVDKKVVMMVALLAAVKAVEKVAW